LWPRVHFLQISLYHSFIVVIRIPFFGHQNTVYWFYSLTDFLPLAFYTLHFTNPPVSLCGTALGSWTSTNPIFILGSTTACAIFFVSSFPLPFIVFPRHQLRHNVSKATGALRRFPSLHRSTVTLLIPFDGDLHIFICARVFNPTDDELRSKSRMHLCNPAMSFGVSFAPLDTAPNALTRPPPLTAILCRIPLLAPRRPALYSGFLGLYATIS
jgi:hypothetical protein